MARLLWELVQFLFAGSPRQFWAWRRGLLRLFGARIGRHVRVHPTVCIAIPWNLDLGDNVAIGDRVILYALGPIRICKDATVSQQAHLCAGTHDHRRSDMSLIKAPIVIGEGAWICADAFVGPGVHVADYAIAGARAVVMDDVAAWTIVAGNRAKPIGKRPRPTAA